MCLYLQSIYSCIDVYLFFFPMARQTLGGLGLLIVRGFAITHFRHTTLGKTSLNVAETST
jgi:hypothetical protein